MPGGKKRRIEEYIYQRGGGQEGHGYVASHSVKAKPHAASGVLVDRRLYDLNKDAEDFFNAHTHSTKLQLINPQDSVFKANAQTKIIVPQDNSGTFWDLPNSRLLVRFKVEPATLLEPDSSPMLFFGIMLFKSISFLIGGKKLDHQFQDLAPFGAFIMSTIFRKRSYIPWPANANRLEDTSTRSMGDEFKEKADESLRGKMGIFGDSGTLFQDGIATPFANVWAAIDAGVEVPPGMDNDTLRLLLGSHFRWTEGGDVTWAVPLDVLSPMFVGGTRFVPASAQMELILNRCTDMFEWATSFWYELSAKTYTGSDNTLKDYSFKIPASWNMGAKWDGQTMNTTHQFSGGSKPAAAAGVRDQVADKAGSRRDGYRFAPKDDVVNVELWMTKVRLTQVGSEYYKRLIAESPLKYRVPQCNVNTVYMRKGDREAYFKWSIDRRPMFLAVHFVNTSKTRYDDVKQYSGDIFTGTAPPGGDYRSWKPIPYQNVGHPFEVSNTAKPVLGESRVALEIEDIHAVINGEQLPDGYVINRNKYNAAGSFPLECIKGGYKKITAGGSSVELPLLMDENLRQHNLQVYYINLQENDEPYSLDRGYPPGQEDFTGVEVIIKLRAALQTDITAILTAVINRDVQIDPHTNVITTDL